MDRGHRSPRVLTAVAVLAAFLLVAAAPPNDPLVSQQAHLTIVGAFDAWDTRRGEGAVVAVLDTGVDLDHPDLAGRLVEGIDLVEPDTPPDDPQGHGTIVAGVIAAVADNGRGVSGVAPQAMVMPIRVLDAGGRGTSDIVADGIRHAIEQQVQVINLSLAEVQSEDDDEDEGTTGPPLLPGVSLVQDREVIRAIEEADEAGILVVAAAGNDGRASTPYDADVPVLVVGATDSDDVRWEESNHDDRTLFAPGVAILSTWSEGRYARSDGTSFATPIVAAGAAMLMGAGVSAEDTVTRLVDTAVRLEDDQEAEVGLGRVDLAAAVQGVDPAPPTTPPAVTTPTPAPATTAPAASTPAPTDGVEVVEPVQEVTEPPPAPAQVTEPPPDITQAAPVATTPPPTAVALEPVEVVTVPTTMPTTPSATPATSAEDTAPGLAVDEQDRGPLITVATMLLGVDVLLAGWVLAGRRT
ncbi:alkaline serine protease, subtilase family [Euzebya pacifica]|uniref:Alkaline serine protease, subtilase family n=1 Tax=Euzebya pacifica TaxID=1608957 RepID=A0A346XVM7_9ACTN|nr:S8 family serine peptidase [Euzebya pacifica]AXV06274.1 alkaline serine protease, subtilase family [Euzebya pacifica]